MLSIFKPGIRQLLAKEASGIHQEPGPRTLKSEGDPYAGIEEIDETEGLCAVSKVPIERKLSKKHKSK